ncbi:Uncharacterized protein GBIM_19125 [Gryllus bimaculatus]|nr:Uncharacterized protein GBIM_19125 [Gryllus bimaculatus]
MRSRGTSADVAPPLVSPLLQPPHPRRSCDHHSHKRKSEDAGRPVAPAWLEAALVERALRAGGGGADTRVVGVRVEAANAAGDGYVSEMFRVRATLAGGAGGERRVVVKSPPAGERFRRLVVPKMERELEAVAPGRFPPFTARCLLWDTEPTHFLMFIQHKLVETPYEWRILFQKFCRKIHSFLLHMKI